MSVFFRGWVVTKFVEIRFIKWIYNFNFYKMDLDKTLVVFQERTLEEQGIMMNGIFRLWMLLKF